MDLLAVQGNLRSLIQHQSSKASVLQCSVVFMVQLSHLYMAPGKIIALTTWTFVGKVMSLLLNTLSRFGKSLFLQMGKPSILKVNQLLVWKELTLCN